MIDDRGWDKEIAPPHHPCATELDPPEMTLAYRTLAAGLVPTAIDSLYEHAELVALWHRAFTLHFHTIYGTFVGAGGFRYSGDPSGLQAWHLRHRLLGMAGATSKLSFDAALTGYYAESAALTRRIVESWAHVAYVRVQPLEGVGWFRSQTGEIRNPNPPKFHAIVSRLKKKDIDQGTINLACELFKYTSQGAHPSPGFLRQSKASDGGEHSYVPSYKSEYAPDVLEWGVCGLLLTLYEQALLEPQPREWHNSYKAIGDDLHVVQSSRTIETT